MSQQIQIIVCPNCQSNIAKATSIYCPICRLALAAPVEACNAKINLYRNQLYKWQGRLENAARLEALGIKVPRSHGFANNKTPEQNSQIDYTGGTRFPIPIEVPTKLDHTNSGGLDFFESSPSVGDDESGKTQHKLILISNPFYNEFASGNFPLQKVGSELAMLMHEDKEYPYDCQQDWLAIFTMVSALGNEISQSKRQLEVAERNLPSSSGIDYARKALFQVKKSVDRSKPEFAKKMVYDTFFSAQDKFFVECKRILKISGVQTNSFSNSPQQGH